MTTEIKYHTIFVDYLRAMQVPFTERYSNHRFETMPFATMFGMVKLLEEYGVPSTGYALTDKNEICRLNTPFLAQTSKGFVIITDIDNAAGRITYLTQGVSEAMPTAEFIDAATGKVILSSPKPYACEPSYSSHARFEFLERAKSKVLALLAVALILYAFFVNGVYHHGANIVLLLLNFAGLFFSYLLVQKSLKVHNSTADRVCGILEKGGCDHVLSLGASKFFGLFGWSEVGFAYFAVNVAVILLFPAHIPTLAILNICCLPFTVWSIWYQRFRAHRWCTLCVSVQTTLWLIFFTDLFGRNIGRGWPIGIDFFVIGALYVAVMLATNAVMGFIEKRIPDE